MRKQSLRVGKAEVLPFLLSLCFKTSSSAKPGQRMPEEPPAAPGASQEFHLSIPPDPVRMPQPLPQQSQHCNSTQPSTFPPLRVAPLPLHLAQGLFPHPGAWRGLKAGANNGLNIVGGGRAAAAGCICPGHRAEEEACTCLAASLSAGNKSISFRASPRHFIAFKALLNEKQSPLGRSSSNGGILLKHPSFLGPGQPLWLFSMDSAWMHPPGTQGHPWSTAEPSREAGNTSGQEEAPVQLEGHHWSPEEMLELSPLPRRAL